MTLNQILYFQKIANLENYHQAAEELYISQPSLSRSMASLENECGIKHPVSGKRAGKPGISGCSDATYSGIGSRTDPDAVPCSV